jgi:hypothetical protein
MKILLAKCRSEIVICLKSASFSSESEFASRGGAETENRGGQKALFGRGAHKVFRVRLGKNFEKHE